EPAFKTAFETFRWNRDYRHVADKAQLNTKYDRLKYQPFEMPVTTGLFPSGDQSAVVSTPMKMIALACRAGRMARFGCSAFMGIQIFIKFERQPLFACVQTDIRDA